MQMAQFQKRDWGVCNVLKGLELIIQDTIDYRTACHGKTVLDQQAVHYRLANFKQKSRPCELGVSLYGAMPGSSRVDTPMLPV